jgi:hypothetical protein
MATPSSKKYTQNGDNFVETIQAAQEETEGGRNSPVRRSRVVPCARMLSADPVSLGTRSSI